MQSPLLAPRSPLLAHVSAALLPLVGGIFMLAAFAKWMHPDATIEALVWAVGPTLAHPSLMCLIVFEGVVGVMLIFSFMTRFAALAAISALLVFSVFLVAKNEFGPPGDCGCGITFIFGDSVTTSLPFNLARNTILIIALLPSVAGTIRRIIRTNNRQITGQQLGGLTTPRHTPRGAKANAAHQ